MITSKGLLTRFDDEKNHNITKLENEYNRDPVSNQFSDQQFDILVGNPPYRSLLDNKSLRVFLKQEYHEIYEGKADLWFYFLYNGIRLLKPKGQLSFVLSRYFLNAPIAKKLNQFLVNNCYIRNIWDFRDYKLFPGTSIQNLILHISKEPPLNKQIRYAFLPNSAVIDKNKDLFSQFSVLNIPQAEIRNQIIKTSKMNLQLYEDNGIHHRIFEKVKKKLPHCLKDCAVVSKGIMSGNDDVFVVTNEIVEKYQLESEFLKNYVKNRHIKPYHLEYDKSLFIIVSHKRNAQKIRQRATNILKYFGAMKQQGRLSTASRSLKDPTSWRNGDERFTIDWHKPKIITPYRSKLPCFAPDFDKFYVPQDVVLIYPKMETEYMNTIYLWTSFFNSVIYQVLMMSGKESGGMKDYLPGQIEPLPIPLYDPNDKIHQNIVELTQKIVTTTQNLKLEEKMLSLWIAFFEFEDVEQEKLWELQKSRLSNR